MVFDNFLGGRLLEEQKDEAAVQKPRRYQGLGRHAYHRDDSAYVLWRPVHGLAQVCGKSDTPKAGLFSEVKGTCRRLPHTGLDDAIPPRMTWATATRPSIREETFHQAGGGRAGTAPEMCGTRPPPHLLRHAQRCRPASFTERAAMACRWVEVSSRRADASRRRRHVDTEHTQAWPARATPRSSPWLARGCLSPRRVATSAPNTNHNEWPTRARTGSNSN